MRELFFLRFSLVTWLFLLYYDTSAIDVKTCFYFFYFGHVFTFFSFSKRFSFLKKRWQSSERQAD